MLGFSQILEIVDLYGDKLQKVAHRYVGHIDFKALYPQSLLYYMEYEDERKNPSWKRRVHRFCPAVGFDKLEELNRYLELAHLCYADTVDEIRRGLAAGDDADDVAHNDTYELVFADLSSEPGKPASYIAVKRHQSPWPSSPLDVVIGVRGTKTFADAVTDLICESQDYRGGKAHAFIVTGGRYLVEKHSRLLDVLRRQAGKKTVKVTLIGHSLGAGAASIAGIEWNDDPNFDVKVVGFGCPALLDKELANKYDFITTIINDNDLVPRLSGIAFANLLLDVMEFDWGPYAKKDVWHALTELRRYQPVFFSRDVIETIMNTIEEPLNDFSKATVKTEKSNRLKPELYPPGKCIHFYRDGYGISAAHVPNDFFEEIDVNRRMIDGKGKRGASTVVSLPNVPPFIASRLHVYLLLRLLLLDRNNRPHLLVRIQVNDARSCPAIHARLPLPFRLRQCRQVGAKMMMYECLAPRRRSKECAFNQNK